MGGGTDIDGDGIWGMDFIPDDNSMTFRKSVFCFGNRITVITTDIEHGTGAKLDETRWPARHQGMINALASAEGKLPAPTRMSPGEEPCWVDGKEVRDFPTETTLAGSAPHWLVDNKGTGYYVPAGNPPLHAARH